MNDDRTLNLLGAFALTIVDAMDSVIQIDVGSGETSAALVSLGAEPGLSITQLRQILQLSHPGTVRLVDRLETQALVERRSGADGRTLALFLTEAGQTKRAQILMERRQQLQRAVTALTPIESQQLTHLLEKMLTTLTATEREYLTICRLCEEEVCPGDRCPVEQQYCRMVQP